MQEWADRAALPSHIVTLLKNFPNNVHPMAQFSSAIAACNSESKFAHAYSKGVKKTEYWEVCVLLQLCIVYLHLCFNDCFLAEYIILL